MRLTPNPVFLLSTLLLALSSSCRMPPSHEVKGRVVGFGDDARTVIVEHEAIPGYMAAMTMSFKALDSTAVQRLAVGDAVAFRLKQTRDSSWIEDLRSVPDDEVAARPAGSKEPAPPADILELLEPGDPIPNTPLLAQDSTAFSLRNFEGTALLLTFIYTRCPMPDYCPLMSRQFQRVQSSLPDRHDDRVALLSISIDPEHDTPSVLREYAKQYTRDTSNWTFATGEPDAVDHLARRFGVFAAAESQGEILHNLTTALVAPDGTVQRIWRGSDWSPDEVVSAIDSLYAARHNS